MQKRMDYIDSLKGIAIFLVVMAHVISNFYDDWKVTLNECPIAMYWWRIIYSFHMPLMFFISGYLFVSKKLLTENLWGIWLHKIQPLVFPYLFMGIIYFLLLDSIESYWFLRTLLYYITGQIIYESIRKRFNLNWICDVCYIIIVWLFIDYVIVQRLQYNDMLNVVFDFPHFIWCWLYFSIGVFMRRYNLLVKVTANKYINTIYPLVTAVYIYWCIGGGNSFPYFLNLVCVFCIIISLYIISRERLTKGYIAKAFQYCGRHTLEIYVIHPFFLLSLPFIGNIIISQCREGTSASIIHGECMEIIASLFISIVTIVLCALIFEPLKSFPLIYKCFLGRDVK